MDKVSYALGMVIARNLKEMGVTELAIPDFSKAVGDVLQGNPTDLADTDAQQTIRQFLQEQQAQAGKSAREDGERFLAENAKKEEVTVLPSGLQYTILKEGNGAKPLATDKVKCHYEGTLINGKVFDSSYRRGEPAVFPLNGVIAGWIEGVQLMAEGAKYRFFIPYNLAYGEHGAGQSIPPYAALIFDVELIEVVK